MNNFDGDQLKKDMKFTDRIGLTSLVTNLPRTLLAFSTTVLLSFFMTAMQAVADNRAIAAGLHKQAEEPLPDILMDWAPSSVPMHMADLFLNSLIAFTIVMFLLSWKWRSQRYGLAEGHFRTLRIARKFFWMLGCAYLFRSFSLLSTTMPPTDPRCAYKQRNWKQIPFMAVEIMTKQGNTCSDKIFSGHSSMATLICLFWLGALLRPDPSVTQDDSSKSIPIWRKFAAVGIVTWTTLVYIFCVLCRNHYSIDIVVAILVCTGIFSVFQLSLRIIELLQIAATEKQNVLQSSSGTALSLAPLIWGQKHVYSPLKEDPEAAVSVTECHSPAIVMKDIFQEAKDMKVHNSPMKAQSISYVPRPFVIFLRAIAWMDGIDLKP